MNIECRTPSGVFFHAQKEVIWMQTKKLQQMIEEGKADNFYQLAE